MQPRTVFTTLCAFLLACLLVACGGDERPTRTGVAEVDAVIDVVAARDSQRLLELLQFQTLPCSEDAGAAGPRCDAEPAGTAVEVFPSLDCEPAWSRRDEIAGLLDAIVASQPGLYAAFETPEGFYFTGRYAAVFEGEDLRSGAGGLKRYVAAGIAEGSGQITGLALGCSIEEPPHFLLPHRDQGFDAWLIEPPD
jgi:hypothetical protein